jgi:hypothetical protein
VLTLDGAGWHQKSDRLVVPDNIGLLHLPPYSPELNPTENIWQFLRQNDLSNRVFATYETIVDACCVAWNKQHRNASDQSPHANTPKRSTHESAGMRLPSQARLAVRSWLRCAIVSSVMHARPLHHPFTF